MRGNRFAQIFATDFGWSGSFPIKQKSQTHETLSLPYQWDGVPPAIIHGNAKKIIVSLETDKAIHLIIECC